MLDQIFKCLHGKYKKGARELNTFYMDQHKHALTAWNKKRAANPNFKGTKPTVQTINRNGAVQIFCALHTDAGAIWISPDEVKAAWRIVGVTQSGIDLGAIPASRLLNDMAPGALEASGIGGAALLQQKPFVSPDRPRRLELLAAAAESPELVADTVEGWKKKALAERALRMELVDFVANPTPIAPAAAGLCEVQKPDWYSEEPTTCRQISNLNMEVGSMDALDMTALKKARKDGERAVVRKGREKTAAAIASRTLCRGEGCQCGQTPCPVASMHRCSFCDKIKKSVCGAKKCKDKRASTAGGHNGAGPMVA